MFDQLLLVRIEGMHCYRCEEAIRRAVERSGAVYEVEVDFPSGQCSVLFDPTRGVVDRYLEAITESGYRVTSATVLRAPTPPDGEPLPGLDYADPQCKA